MRAEGTPAASVKLQQGWEENSSTFKRLVEEKPTEEMEQAIRVVESQKSNVS